MGLDHAEVQAGVSLQVTAPAAGGDCGETPSQFMLAALSSAGWDPPMPGSERRQKKRRIQGSGENIELFYC